MTKGLTDLECKHATSNGRPQRDIADGEVPGLTLRVTSRGKKTWSLFYKRPGTGKPGRISLGHYPNTTASEARKRAREKLGLAEGGVDLGALAKAKPAMTIAELIQDRYTSKLAPAGRAHLRTVDEIMRRYSHDVTPVVGGVAVKEFTVQHWRQIVTRMEKRQAFVLANRVFKDMKALLNHAVEIGELGTGNPLLSLPAPFPKEERTGERYLTVEEIKHLWATMPKALVRSPQVQLIIMVLLATGKRSNEVCGARRCEIDWGRKLWTIPADRVKGEEGDAKDEIVPLSDLALALFRRAALGNNSEWLFPNEAQDGPTEPRTVSKAVKLALAPTPTLPLGRLGMAKWKPHDLRRTVGTQLLNRRNGLGIERQQKYLVLNHKTLDATDREERNDVSDRVYDGNDYLDDKREALEKWGGFLAELVAPSQLMAAE